MALTPEIAAAAAVRLDRERDRYEKFVRIASGLVRSLVRDHNIPATVQGRVKSAHSLERKLSRYIADRNTEKIESIANEDDVFAVVGDIAGIRIATYVESDRSRAVDLIRQAFTDVEVEVHAKSSGYRATHCQVGLPQSASATQENTNIAEVRGEIQICSMLGHVWNEIEHSIRYKSVGVEGDDALESGLLLNLQETATEGDRQIEELLKRRSERSAEAMLEEVQARFPSAANFESNGLDVLALLVRLGHPDIESVRDFLGGGDVEARAQRGLGQLNLDLTEMLDDAFRLTPDTADLLLALILAAKPREVLACCESITPSDEIERIQAIATAQIALANSQH